MKGHRVGMRCVVVALLLTSCGCMSLPWKSREPETFLEAFKTEDAAKPFENVLDPSWSKGHGTNSHGGHRAGYWNKNFEFSGVRQDRTVVIDALQKVRDDMLARVKASGAEVRGEVRLTCEKGIMQKFEFDYRHHGKNGTVIGEVRRCEHKPGWDLECVVSEEAETKPWNESRLLKADTEL